MKTRMIPAAVAFSLTVCLTAAQAVDPGHDGQDFHPVVSVGSGYTAASKQAAKLTKEEEKIASEIISGVNHKRHRASLLEIDGSGNDQVGESLTPCGEAMWLYMEAKEDLIAVNRQRRAQRALIDQFAGFSSQFGVKTDPEALVSAKKAMAYFQTELEAIVNLMEILGKISIKTGCASIGADSGRLVFKVQRNVDYQANQKSINGI